MYKVISTSRWGGLGGSFYQTSGTTFSFDSMTTSASQQSFSSVPSQPRELCDKSSRESGIINIGNTCYLNSTLQLLRVLSPNCHSPAVQAILKKLNEKTLTDVDIKAFFNNHAKPEKPLSLTAAESALFDYRYNLHRQQDASEILGRLLEKFALMSIQSKVEPQEGTFVGTASTTIEPQSVICVPIFPGLGDFSSLLDHEYGASQVVEHMTGDNQYKDNSGTLVDAKKSHSLRLPTGFKSGDVVLFSLKRFQGDAVSQSKIDTEIVTPATFDMDVSGVRCRFELVAGIIHRGPLAGGHYWSFTRDQAGCTVFDDSTVSRCPLDQVPGITKAYVLAYKVTILQ
jgi:ubiquitin C-terminal hydrolase